MVIEQVYNGCTQYVFIYFGFLIFYISTRSKKICHWTLKIKRYTNNFKEKRGLNVRFYNFVEFFWLVGYLQPIV